MYPNTFTHTIHITHKACVLIHKIHAITKKERCVAVHVTNFPTKDSAI